MTTQNQIVYKKWRLKVLLRWIGSCLFAATIIPLAVIVGEFWLHLATILLPFAFGIMLGADIKNGIPIVKNRNE